jgi:hypothetical protein
VEILEKNYGFLGNGMVVSRLFNSQHIVATGGNVSEKLQPENSSHKVMGVPLNHPFSFGIFNCKPSILYLNIFKCVLYIYMARTGLPCWYVGEMATWLTRLVSKHKSLNPKTQI